MESTGLSTLERYAVLDRSGDTLVDELLRIASVLCGAEHAVLGRLDAGGWIREVHVAPADASRRFAPLATYGLFQRAPFQHADARLVPALRADPVVNGRPGVAFLAGVPVVDSSNELVGTLCVLSSTPSTISAAHLEALAGVARSIGAQWHARDELGLIRERHRRHLARLHELEGVFRAASGFAIVRTEVSGVIGAMNPCAERMLGDRRENVVGHELLTSFLDPAELGAFVRDATSGSHVPEPIDALAVLGTADTAREWTMCGRDGSKTPVALVVAPIRDEEEALQGYVAIAQDISERRALDRLKDDFIASVSHEFRTPLTSIRGSIGLILGGVAGESSPQVNDLLAIADRNCARLTRLVEDLLDLRKIESGALEFRFDRCDLAKIVTETVDANRAIASEIQLALELDPLITPIWVRADTDRIAQALTNLLSNSVRFSAAGDTVRIAVSRRPDAICVMVSDSGPGIPEDFRGQIWGTFRQGRSGSVRESGGAGLGLSIVRSIVTRHGGTVGFRSTVGHGSEFWFDLPEDRER